MTPHENTPHENTPHESLFAALVDGTLSADDRARLAALLKQDPAARQRYVDLMLLDTLLAEELAAESIKDMVDALSPSATLPMTTAPSRGEDVAELARVRGPLVHPPNSGESGYTSARRSRRWFATMGAAAASLLIGAALWTIYGPENEVSAAMLLNETLRVHQLPLDRCYVVKIEKIGERENPLWGFRPRIDRLWTRGDRFFLESSTDKARFKWGQDADGRVWMTHGKNTGMTFEAKELPPWLAIVCDALSMRLEPMLDEVLKHCELTWEENPSEPTTRIVRAVNVRGAQPLWLKEARLEIDLETKVLKKLTVVRRLGQRQSVTVSYTLAASEAQSDDRYELRGHLEEPCVVYSKGNLPAKRSEILSEHFGNRIARSLLTPVESPDVPEKK